MENMTTITITKDQFDAYERVRQSGVTNMWDITTVCRYSGGELEEYDVMEIIKNYDEYAKAYA